jgi:hypothetical protein
MVRSTCLLPDGNQGRIDLMFSKVIQPRSGEYDYLALTEASVKRLTLMSLHVEKYATLLQ